MSTYPEAAPRSSERAPVLFVGHGSPLNAIEDNRWSRGFLALGATLEKPRAVLSVSAHWWTRGTLLTADSWPRTIHDFGGFPRELFEVRYPAPEAPDLARRVVEWVARRADRESPNAALSDAWGLDHGTWSVLRHLFPDADVPDLQLSLYMHKSPAQHASLGRALADLRDQGVLILVSGNVTHNLSDAARRKARGQVEPPAWARAFDDEVERMVGQRDLAALARLWPEGANARQAHPHPDHCELPKFAVDQPGRA